MPERMPASRAASRSPRTGQEAVNSLAAYDRIRDWRFIVDASRSGLPVGWLDTLASTGRMTSDEIGRLIVSARNLSVRRKAGHLSTAESDRLVRVMHVLLAAESTFGSVEKAADWLRRPTTMLDGERPLDLLDTTGGSREVEHVLGRIDHGIAA